MEDLFGLSLDVIFTDVVGQNAMRNSIAKMIILVK